jgi:cobalt-zinc-cadmium efflux system membrane fusion protein
VIEAVSIQVEKAELRECPLRLKAMGKILAPQSRTAIVSHFLPGRIAAVHVKVGDAVQKGESLVTLECSEVGDAMSEFFKAVANHELAQLNLRRETQLAADGIGAKKNHLAAETDFKVAQASLEAAEKRLHILGFTEEQVQEIIRTHQISPAITLNSPIEGKVVASQAVIGAMVDQSKEILTIIDPRLLWVDAEIYEKDVTKVEIGQKVEVFSPAYPTECFPGTVSYIADVVNEDTRTITVRTEVDNSDDRLKPGMFADVHILVGAGQKMLTVPLAAILEEGDRKIVFVKGKEGYLRREVQTGPVNGQYQRIVHGLTAGEEIVVEGNHQLKSKLNEAILQRAHVH